MRFPTFGVHQNSYEASKKCNDGWAYFGRWWIVAGEIPLFRELVASASQVRIHPEDLLDDHDNGGGNDGGTSNVWGYFDRRSANARRMARRANENSSCHSNVGLQMGDGNLCDLLGRLARRKVSDIV